MYTDQYNEQPPCIYALTSECRAIGELITEGRWAVLLVGCTDRKNWVASGRSNRGRFLPLVISLAHLSQCTLDVQVKIKARLQRLTSVRGRSLTVFWSCSGLH